jgi:hypothetical protein
VTARPRTIRGFALTIAFTLLVLASHASAASSPPKTVLRAEGHVQRGGLVWEEWTSGGGGGHCVGLVADGTGTYPKPLRLGSGLHHARFVLLRRQKPRRVKVTAWHAIDSSGYETGRSEALPYTLQPRRDDEGVLTAWKVRFSLDPPPNYYLHLYVRWPNGKCGGPRHVLRTYSIGG